jgi:hypothetical protein
LVRKVIWLGDFITGAGWERELAVRPFEALPILPDVKIAYNVKLIIIL